LGGGSGGWYVSYLLAFDILDTSWQNPGHLFALWASSILGAKPFAIAFCYQGALLSSWPKLPPTW